MASTLREVDWRNRGDLPGVVDLHDGRSELHEYGEDGLHDTAIFKLDGVLYGDLSADGVEGALVIINGLHYPAHSYGTPRRSGRAFLFTLREGLARLLTSLDLCCWPIEHASLVGGALAFTRDEGQRSCAVRYRLRGTSWREDEAARRCSTAAPRPSQPGP